ncbi:barstar family protein [Paenibacillus senegalensis]|uniref:barstar family protein n=1 Tax=Paenibacillus senegalensis TaxID=1465766 RepID=UPI00028A1773|nr:barstar family protein [Paenibacillus senegalensis]
MNEIRINGRAITSREQLHSQLKEQLGLPDHYGRNLDALWDGLTGSAGLPLTIYWEHYSISAERLGEYASKVAQLFREAEEELEGFHFVVN